MNKIIIYLAGSIKKEFLNEDKKILIDNKIKDQLLSKLSDFDVILLDPNESKFLGKKYARFGKDMLQVNLSNFLITDLREKRGIGVGAEMMIARIHKTPIVAVCPPESHYLRVVNGEKWVHPFVSALSDVVVNNFEEASQWIANFTKNSNQIKSLEDIKQYIDIYKNECLESDQQFLEKYKQIKN